MDPQACFDEWCALLSPSVRPYDPAESDRIDELCDAYDEWIGKRGHEALTDDGAPVRALSSTGRYRVGLTWYELD